jgi:hypothetical protein
MWTGIVYLHCYSREAKEIKLEKTDHDLIVLIHCFDASDKDSFIVLMSITHSSS